MKTIEAIFPVKKARVSEGFEMYGFRHPDIDPFMDITLFSMSRPTFRPHPHAGFSAVTYMTPESEGSFVNRDSLGDHTKIWPGDTHWTQAGSGMMHEEAPETPGVPCLGFQMFIKLSAEEELSPPQAFHLDGDRTPVLQGEGWLGRLICGHVNGVSGGLKGTRHNAFLLDIAAEPDTEVKIRIEKDSSCWAFVRSGSLQLTGQAAGAVSVLVMSLAGNEVRFRTGPDGATVLIGGGKPLREAFQFGGPFALSTGERLSAAAQRFAEGGMGHLPASF